MTDRLTDMFEALERGRAAMAKATAWVEWEADPDVPGRTTYRITGATRAAVQAAINARFNATEESGGEAHFIGPTPIEGGKFCAMVVVILNVEAANVRT